LMEPEQITDDVLTPCEHPHAIEHTFAPVKRIG
jgi:hypothetical protein